MEVLFSQLASRANKSDETAWAIGRIVLVSAVVLGNATFMAGTSAQLPIFICAAAALIYNVPLLLLLRRGRVQESFVAGFLLDNVTLLVGWWFCVSSLAGEKQTNDLWLVLAPILIFGVARVGWKTGVVYTLGWLTWMGVTHYVSYGPDSYDVQQLPMRIAFLGAGSIIVGRLVGRLDSEKRQAAGLRSEADQIAEIGRLASSTLDFSSVFKSIAGKTAALVPYDGLSVTEVNSGDKPFRVVEIKGGRMSGLDGDTAWPFERTVFESSIRRHEPLSFDSNACENLLERFQRRTGTRSPDIRSMLVVPVVANDVVIAIVVAWSRSPDVFDEDHLAVLSRIGGHLSGALANAQLHRKSMELERLTALSEAQSSLLSSVSHELKTPLTSMMAFTDLLLRNKTENLTERQCYQLSMIRSGERQLVGLIDDLLDVSRIENGRVMLDLELVDITELVTEVVDSLAPVAEHKSQWFEVEFGPGMGHVEADSRRLLQVLRNLLSNASKYSPESTGIRVSAEADQDGVSISVADSGIGMAQDDIEQLFTPFFRSTNPEATRLPGTGLGLVIVKGLVEAHGGRISVDSMLGLGTTVRVKLPRGDVAAVEDRIASGAA